MVLHDCAFLNIIETMSLNNLYHFVKKRHYVHQKMVALLVNENVFQFVTFKYTHIIKVTYNDHNVSKAPHRGENTILLKLDALIRPP